MRSPPRSSPHGPHGDEWRRRPDDRTLSSTPNATREQLRHVPNVAELYAATEADATARADSMLPDWRRMVSANGLDRVDNIRHRSDWVGISRVDASALPGWEPSSSKSTSLAMHRPPLPIRKIHESHRTNAEGGHSPRITTCPLPKLAGAAESHACSTPRRGDASSTGPAGPTRTCPEKRGYIGVRLVHRALLRFGITIQTIGFGG